MTPNTAYKYNPGFSADVDLLSNFVIRQHELDLLVQVVRENTNSSTNRHVLVVGPRGLGKTTLVRGVAARMRSDSDLIKNWYAVVYGEESYNITSPGEFWLECLYHIAKQENDDEVLKLYENLRRIYDPEELQDRCIDQLKQIAASKNVRLCLFVENLNQIFDEQMSDDSGWSIRHVLQNEPSIMLFATATSFFDEIENVERALFEQFKIHHLGPLSISDCQRLWLSVTGEKISQRSIRPVQILTGGNPRLIAIWAQFSVNLSFKELVDRISHIVDEYTDYFKGHLEALPSAERKIFAAVLELWDPATTKQIAEWARLPTNTASALLGRLERRGAVKRDANIPPRWQATERLFNIYYLMRRRGSPSGRVQALVSFMTVYYGRDQLMERVADLAREACSLHPEHRQDHYFAFANLLGRFDQSTRRMALERIPKEFLSSEGLPRELLRVLPGHTDISGQGAGSSRISALDELRRLIEEGDAAKALEYFEQNLEQIGDEEFHYFKGLLQLLGGSLAEAEVSLKQAAALDQNNANVALAIARLYTLQNRDAEAIEWFRAAVALDPGNVLGWRGLGEMLVYSGNRGEAETALRRAIDLAPTSRAWVHLAMLAIDAGNLGDTEEFLKTAIEVDDRDGVAWGMLGQHYLEVEHDLEKAEHALRRSTELSPARGRSWVLLGRVLSHDDDRFSEASEAFQKAIGLGGSIEIEARLGLAIHAHVHGKPELIEGELLAISQHPARDAKALLAISALRRMQEDDVAAEAALRAAINIEPDDGYPWTRLGNFLKDVGRFEEAEEAYLQAIRLAPEECEPEHALGALRLVREQHVAAESAFSNALQKNPGCSCAARDLGRCLRHRNAPVADQLAVIQAVLAADPSNGASLFLMGEHLTDYGSDFEAARSHLIRAYEAGEDRADIWEKLVELQLKAAKSVDSIISDLNDLAARLGDEGPSSNAIAWSLHLKGDTRLFEYACYRASLAVKAEPQNWAFRHTYASTLLDNGNIAEAVEEIEELARTVGRNEINDLVDLCVSGAKLGAGLPLLKALTASENSSLVEPLIVALKMHAGEKIQVAQEVREVAADIQNRIIS